MTDSTGSISVSIKSKTEFYFSMEASNYFFFLTAADQEPKKSSKRPLTDDAADKAVGVKKRRKMSKDTVKAVRYVLPEWLSSLLFSDLSKYSINIFRPPPRKPAKSREEKNQRKMQLKPRS